MIYLPIEHGKLYFTQVETTLRINFQFLLVIWADDCLFVTNARKEIDFGNILLREVGRGREGEKKREREKLVKTRVFLYRKGPKFLKEK